jgi:uncharacterized DUF497 family protein
MIKFEWGEAKALKNIEKHGISFQEASTVFYMILQFNSMM